MSRRSPNTTTDPIWARIVILALVAAFLAGVLILPLVSVFFEALRKGLPAALEAIATEDARAAIKLTVGHLYENREQVIVASGLAPVDLPLGVDALLATWRVWSF